MSHEPDDARRARRLLRWYPAAWRDRYGDEFVEHLQQEFADRSFDVKRTINTAYKGLVARVADVGLLNAEADVQSRFRAAAGTTFVLSAMVTFIALDFGSRAMLAWNQWSRASIANSVATGALTAATGLLMVVLLVIVLLVMYCAARQMIRGRARGLVGSSILALASGGFLLYVARSVPSQLARYVHGAAGFPGIRWSHPGQVVQALAQITWDNMERWIGPWHQGMPRVSVIQSVVNDGVPVAAVVFGVAIALLLRKVDLPRQVNRLVWYSVIVLGSLITVFFIAYIVWSFVGGSVGGEYFSPESAWLGVTYLVFMPLAGVLVARTGLLARGVERTTTVAANENGD